MLIVCAPCLRPHWNTITKRCTTRYDSDAHLTQQKTNETDTRIPMIFGRTRSELADVRSQSRERRRERTARLLFHTCRTAVAHKTLFHSIPFVVGEQEHRHYGMRYCRSKWAACMYTVVTMAERFDCVFTVHTAVYLYKSIGEWQSTTYAGSQCLHSRIYGFICRLDIVQIVPRIQTFRSVGVQ